VLSARGRSLCDGTQGPAVSDATQFSNGRIHSRMSGSRRRNGAEISRNRNSSLYSRIDRRFGADPFSPSVTSWGMPVFYSLSLRGDKDAACQCPDRRKCQRKRRNKLLQRISHLNAKPVAAKGPATVRKGRSCHSCYVESIAAHSPAVPPRSRRSDCGSLSRGPLCRQCCPRSSFPNSIQQGTPRSCFRPRGSERLD
jgi:hypothetical protein